MKSIYLISLAILLSFTSWGIASFFYPPGTSNNDWDNVKHEIYILRSMCILGAVFFHLDPKYVPLFHFLAWGLFGTLLAQYTDKLVGDTEHMHKRDVAFVALAFYGGLYKANPEWHKKLGVGIITVITLGLAPSAKIYSWLLKKFV